MRTSILRLAAARRPDRALALAATLACSLALACASTPAAGGDGGPGASCREPADCRPALLCEEATGTGVEDECRLDGCDQSRLGQGRCETIADVLCARTCTYDGVRCLEWSPQACEEGETCVIETEGAACFPAGP